MSIKIPFTHYSLSCKVRLKDNRIEDGAVFHFEKQPKSIENSAHLPARQLFHKFKSFQTAVASTSSDTPVHFRSSGPLGDIIYAIPLTLAIANGRPIHIKFNLNAFVSGFYSHPLKGIGINSATYEQLKPLLDAQNITSSPLTKYKSAHPVLDLDCFRTTKKKCHNYALVRCYGAVYPQTYDTSQPWIKVKPSPVTQGAIVVTRSFRYNNPKLCCRFLEKYPQVYFLGLEEEYRQMKFRHVQYLPVENFLQAAEYIAGARLFIGNQTFLFSLAEAMKCPRILEICRWMPDIIPEGGYWYGALFQNQLEYVVHQFMAT
jgi:hypothetical protein